MPVWPERGPYLVVSASGRALARSASRAGIAVVVLDLFDDVDTRALAVASRACAGRSGRFHSARVVRAARELAPAGGYAGLVCGSGLEARPSLLEWLAHGSRLFGNSPQTVLRAKDPCFFFPLLDRLRIAHPEVRTTPPRDPRGWLAKRVGGAGGAHVRPAHLRWPRKDRRYFQRWCNGRLMSALFLAHQGGVSIIGISEQWPVALSPAVAFAYGGAVIADDVPQTVYSAVASATARVAQALGLRGLNGLDFILCGETPYVLELNPRPTATLDLYDAFIPGGLFLRHLLACTGSLETDFVPSLRPRAHAIVYAARAWRVPEAFAWPQWVTDIPAAGSTIAMGAPVCTVHAQGTSTRSARTLALSRREQVLALCWRQAA